MKHNNGKRSPRHQRIDESKKANMLSLYAKEAPRKLLAGTVSVVLAASMVPIIALADSQASESGMLGLTANVDSESSQNRVSLPDEEKAQDGPSKTDMLDQPTSVVFSEGPDVSRVFRAAEIEDGELDQLLKQVDYATELDENQSVLTVVFSLKSLANGIDPEAYSLACALPSGSTAFGSAVDSAIVKADDEGNLVVVEFALKADAGANAEVNLAAIEFSFERLEDNVIADQRSNGSRLTLPATSVVTINEDKEAPVVENANFSNDGIIVSGKRFYQSTSDFAATVNLADSSKSDYQSGISALSVSPLTGFAVSSSVNSDGTASITVSAEESAANTTVNLADIYVTCVDKADNRAEIALSDIFGCSAICFDNVAPKVSMNTDAGKYKRQKYYFAENQSAQVTLQDDNLSDLLEYAKHDDATAKQTAFYLNESVFSSYGITLGDLAELSGSVSNGQLTLDVKVSKKSVDKPYVDGTTVYVSEGTYTLLLLSYATDLTGNAFAVAEGSNDRARFVFDATAPEVTLSTDIASQKQYNNTYYFNADQALKLTVSEPSNLEDLLAESPNMVIAHIEGTQKDGTRYESDVTASSFEISDAGDSAQATVNIGQDEDSLPEGSYIFTLLPAPSDVVDLSGNQFVVGDSSVLAERGSIAFVYDATAPVVKSVESDVQYVNSYDDNGILFHNAVTTLAVNVSDPYGVLYQDFFNDALWQGADFTSDPEGKAVSTATFKMSEGFPLTRDLYYTVEDYAGNRSTWRISKDGFAEEVFEGIAYPDDETKYPQTVIQDTVAPVVSLSGVSAGTYYNTPQSVLLAIVERNFGYVQRFDGAQPILTISKQEGNASLAESSWSRPANAAQAQGDVEFGYTLSESIREDGHYTVFARVTDPAGNSAEESIGTFTVDQTAPVINVSWDVTRSSGYYNTTRTATVTVVEHNFDASLVTIAAQGGTVGGWSHNGDTHTATVFYGSDGPCGLSVSAADLAGNAASRSESDFVVDMTAPTIDFGGVDDSHAYNGEVRPLIDYADATSFDANGTSYTLVGNKVGQVDYDANPSLFENGKRVTFNDFVHAITVDDIYTLTAHVTDLAGNSTEKSITFSVNRFGSNFIVVNPTSGDRVNPVDQDDLYDFGFQSEAPEILVREINVDSIDPDQSAVAVTYNLKTTNLDRVESTARAGFTLTDETDGDGWKVYDYTISRESFIGSTNGSTDGNYKVEVSSVDAAGNHNTSSQFWESGTSTEDETESQRSSAVVKFTLDTTAPEVYGVTVEDGGFYANAGSYQVSFAASDNIGFDPENVKVLLNGNVVETTRSEGASGQYDFEIGQGILGFENLSIEVTDYAGNVKTFRAAFTDLLWPAVVVAVVVIVAAGIAGAVVVRRRKVAQEEE